MKRIVLAAALIIGLIPPTWAQVLPDAREMSTWMLKAQALYEELFAVTNYSDQLDDISSALIDEEITAAFALRKGRQYILQARLSYDKVSKEIDCCLSTPNVQAEIFVKSARDFSQYLHTLRDQVRDIIDDSEGIFKAAIDGKADTVQRLQFKQAERWIILIESENVLMRTQRVLVKSSHPQHALYGAMISGNKALVASMSSVFDLASGRLEIPDPESSRLLVERELLNMRRAINDGRQAVFDWKIRVSALRPKTIQIRQMMATLTHLLENYSKTFDVEEQMASTLSAVADALLSGVEDFLVSGLRDFSLELFETEMLKVEVLIDQRLRLYSERLRLLGELGDQ